MCADNNCVRHDPPKRRPCIELLDDAMVEVLRGKTKAERVAMVFDAERTMRLMLETNLHWRHPTGTLNASQRNSPEAKL